MGTLRSFCCAGFNMSKKSARTLTLRMRPTLENNFGIYLQKHDCHTSISLSSSVFVFTSASVITQSIWTNCNPWVLIKLRPGWTHDFLRWPKSSAAWPTHLVRLWHLLCRVCWFCCHYSLRIWIRPSREPGEIWLCPWLGLIPASWNC